MTLLWCKGSQTVTRGSAEAPRCNVSGFIKTKHTWKRSVKKLATVLTCGCLLYYHLHMTFWDMKRQQLHIFIPICIMKSLSYTLVYYELQSWKTLKIDTPFYFIKINTNMINIVFGLNDFKFNSRFILYSFLHIFRTLAKYTKFQWHPRA